MSINSISHRKKGDQMDFIYKWLEKRLFKKRHEVMKLQFQKVKIQQELDRAKQNKEYMNMLNKSMTEAAAGEGVVKSLDELREYE